MEMEIEVEIEEARRCWPYWHKVAASGVVVVLLRNGKPIGALVSQEDYAWLQQQKALLGETGPPNWPN
jgi:prevent-host-death family protein